MPLLTLGKSNAKLAKSDKAGKGYATIALHLAPAKLSGYQVCSSSTAGCRAACLNTAGHGAFSTVQNARIERTQLLFKNRRQFEDTFIMELDKFVKKCVKNKVKPCCRLNCTSDIIWEKVWPELFAYFPQVQFYDYTKHYKRMLGVLPSNYYLTFSRNEKNEQSAIDVLNDGRNIAVVFYPTLPKKWNGFKVYNGDTHDLRFLDHPGQVCGLIAKGKGKKDTSEFVVRI